MDIMNAIEFCKKLDNELGETWSNDYQELPEKMEEYAKIYHEQQLKILNIPVVSNNEVAVCPRCNDDDIAKSPTSNRMFCWNCNHSW